jgi:transcriptional regulator with XRE-family HTH domain
MISPQDRQYLGAQLLRLRRATGLTGPQVAAQVGRGWAQSKISRVENGRVGATVADLAVLLQFYGACEEVQAELLTLAASGDAVDGTWVVRSAGTPRRQRDLGAIEQRLTRLRHYQAILVPGLLQAPAYTDAIVRAGDLEFPEALVARRQQRQRVLLTPGALRYEVVLDARALLYRPGGIEVTLAQFDHLQERAMLPAVELRVVPLQAGHASLAMTPFMIFDFRSGTTPPVVLVETHDADLYHCAPVDLASYATRFARLQRDALDPGDSLDYLQQLRRELLAPVSLRSAEAARVR